MGFIEVLTQGTDGTGSVKSRIVRVPARAGSTASDISKYVARAGLLDQETPFQWATAYTYTNGWFLCSDRKVHLKSAPFDDGGNSRHMSFNAGKACTTLPLAKFFTRGVHAKFSAAGAACKYTSRAEVDAAQILDGLVNWEAVGVPSLAGTSQSDTFDLARMRRLLARLGDPQQQWPVVHVAGTKGKGSTVALLAAVLRAAGLKVGVYSSPHVHHIRERISTLAANEPIPSPTFETLVAEHRAVLEAAQHEEAGRLSHFEAMTALAFRHFADESVDIAVVETGLGGTTDATNVFSPEKLQAAVITSIGLEHVAALGGSLASIAAAKAGILKAGRPAVLAAQREPTALGVLRARAEELGCDVTLAPEVVRVQDRGYQVDSSSPRLVSQLVDLELVSQGGSGGPAPTAAVPWLEGVRLRLVGPHQQQNVAAAAATIGVLRRQGWQLPDSAVRAGLEEAWLPGRFQVLPLAAPGASGASLLLLDGAHSGESAEALVATLTAALPGRPLALVVAMAADKEHRAVLAALRRARPSVVVFTAVPIAGSQQRSCPPGVLVGHWQAAAILDVGGRPLRCRELIQASMGAAIAKARQELRAFPGEGVVLVTGSLHAVAQAEQAAAAAEA